MSARKVVEEVETFVLLPYPEFKSMDQRVKKAEEEGSRTSENVMETQTSSERKEEVEKSEPSKLENQTGTEMKKKDMTKSYRKTHLKKLIQQIHKSEDSKEILKLDNLDALIESALNNSKKTLPNEEVFSDFFFKTVCNSL